MPSKIARRRWPFLCCGKVANGDSPTGTLVNPPFHLLTRLSRGCIINDEYLIAEALSLQMQKGLQATVQRCLALIGRNNHRNIHAHSYTTSGDFCKRKEPITRASSGDVQKHSI